MRGPVVTLLIGLLLVLSGAVPAVSAVPTAPAAAAPYSSAPTLAVDDPDPCAQATVHVSGVGYPSRSRVVLRIGTTVLATVTTRADGSFVSALTLRAGQTGRLTIVGTGRGAVASTDITVDAHCVGGVHADPGSGTGVGTGTGTGTGPSASGGYGIGPAAAILPDTGSSRGASGLVDYLAGGLASTGVAVVALVGAALAMLVAGVLLLFGSRRRRHAAT